MIFIGDNYTHTFWHVFRLQKDEGGPLIDYASNKLIGIYDHGTQCSGDAPDVFVDVRSFSTWINANAV